MDKAAFLPLSGFRDWNSPTKDWVSSAIRQIFKRYGYQPLETPAIERQEILLDKLGPEAQKLLYLFNDNGGRSVGLRYDLTVPLARFVAGSLGELPLPYKRFEIGPVWRAERAQKGRQRQFTQADIDIVGDNNAAGSEKELLMVVADVQRALGVDWLCLLNDRRLVAHLLETLGVAEADQPKLLQALDKKDKLTEAELETELKKVGLTDVQLKQVSSIFLIEDDALERVRDFVEDKAVLARVDELLQAAESVGLKASFAPFMVRGLEYYTGTIIECVAPDYPSSLVGGGRYDTLIEKLTGQLVPSVGLSFGVDRIADYLDAQANVPSDSEGYLGDRPAVESPLFIVNLPETETEVGHWLSERRRSGQAIERYLDSRVELGKQIKYADKRGFSEILIPFEDEWKQGQIVRKNLASGTQQTISRDQLANG